LLIAENTLTDLRVFLKNDYARFKVLLTSVRISVAYSPCGFLKGLNILFVESSGIGKPMAVR
jgi:hypothetical protein